jgi:UDP-N-acetylmuramoyl-tripeptide--D-alanyl-D-alanine ligase
MAELGEGSGAMHSEVGQRASAAGVDRLLTLGVQSRLSTDAFGAGATHYTSLPALVSDCKALMDLGTTVLVKGSRSANMDRVVDQLKIQEAGKC